MVSGKFVECLVYVSDIQILIRETYFSRDQCGIEAITLIFL